MKTRNGFVSNSSSSSFIVLRRGGIGKSNEKLVITKEEEKKLEKFGFKKVWCYYSDQVDTDERYDGPKTKILKDYYNYGYSVSCNQNDVIYFLLKNNIPFEASCHYNHYKTIYNRGSKSFVEVQNYGEQCVMENMRDVERKDYLRVLSFEKQISSKPIVESFNVKQWLKQEEKWQKQYAATLKKEIAEYKKSV